jgi:hypothetical protein
VTNSAEQMDPLETSLGDGNDPLIAAVHDERLVTETPPTHRHVCQCLLNNPPSI